MRRRVAKQRAEAEAKQHAAKQAEERRRAEKEAERLLSESDSAQRAFLVAQEAASEVAAGHVELQAVAEAAENEAATAINAADCRGLDSSL